MKINNTNTNHSLDLKRCYLPIVITDTCPTCGEEVSKDLSRDYLSYPTINQPFKTGMYHYIEGSKEDGSKNEEHEWNVIVVLRVSMEAAP